LDKDAAAVRAVSKQVLRVAGPMDPQDLATTVLAWSRFAKSGIQLTSILDTSSWHSALVKKVFPHADECSR